MSNTNPYHYPSSEYGLSRGSRVYLVAQPNKRGNVTFLDTTKPHPTNCSVMWDDRTTSQLLTSQISNMRG